MTGALPELFCPFPAVVRHGEAEALVSWALDWTAKHQLLPDASERTIAKVRSYALLAASCYPSAPFARLAAICDYYSWLFLFDDTCEDLSLQGASPREVHGFLRGIYGVLSGTAGAAIGAQRVTAALADIWQRVAQACPAAWRQRLARHVANYIDGCVWEAQNRQLGQVPSRAVFQVMRMFTSTMYEFWDFIEYAGGWFLPDHVVEHPVIAELQRTANAVASFANDIFSLRKEMKNRDFHNLVVVVQHEDGLDLPAALLRAAALHDEQVRHYCALERIAPSFAPDIDRDVARYLEGMRTWMRANHDWSMTTPRYHEDRR
jgi:hypothetical protein